MARVVIKAGTSGFVNALLTVFLAIPILAESFLIYLLFVNSGSLLWLILAFAIFAVIGIIGRIWLWNVFGEESIEVRGNHLIGKRNNSLYVLQEQNMELIGSIDICYNRSANGYWKGLQKRGVFKIGSNDKVIDFGININEDEYYVLLSHLNNLLICYKNISEQTTLKSANLTLEKSIENKQAIETNISTTHPGKRNVA